MTRPLATRILPNGLTVVVREDRKAPVVTVNLWVRVGANHEDDSVLGWSHGIEHLMFKGTARRGPGVAAREVRDAGGVLNAGTGYETTNYYITVPTRSLRVAFNVQADAIQNSAFDEAELDRERSVIIEENRMYRDQPSGFGHTWEKLMSLAFEVSNYRRPIGGPDESLRTTPRDAIVAYRDRRYVPGNAALVIAGDVAAAEALALAEAAYGGWRAAPVPDAALPVEPAQRAARFRAAPGPVAKCYVKMGWRAGPETDRDTYAILVLVRLLARGRSSWIHQELLEKRGLLSEVSVLQETGSRESIFVLDMVTDLDALDPLVLGVDEGIARFRDALATEEDLERAKNFMVRSHVLAQETVDAQAHALGHAFARGDVTLADRYPEIVGSITRDDVRRVAGAFFDLPQCSILVHHPEAAGRVERPAALVRRPGPS